MIQRGEQIQDAVSHFRAAQEQAFRRGFTVYREVAASPCPTVMARIDQGRWLADCPFCRGAELVFFSDPFFLCQSCYNQAVGGKRLPVIIPRQADAIEALLNKRPLAENRNWLPRETIADLAAENRSHGIK